RRGVTTSLPGRSPHRIELPFLWHPLESVRTAILERDARTSDEVNDGSRDEHFAGTCLFHHARRQVHREATDVAAKQLELAGVEAAPHLEIQSSHGLGHGTRTLDRAGGSVERGERAVASSLDECSTESFDLVAHEGVEIVQDLVPAPVADLGGTLCRGHDIGEQHGG